MADEDLVDVRGRKPGIGDRIDGDPNDQAFEIVLVMFAEGGVGPADDASSHRGSSRRWDKEDELRYSNSPGSDQIGVCAAKFPHPSRTTALGPSSAASGTGPPVPDRSDPPPRRTRGREQDPLSCPLPRRWAGEGRGGGTRR